MTYIGDVPHGNLVVPVILQVTPVHSGASQQMDYPTSKHSNVRHAFSSSLNRCFDTSFNILSSSEPDKEFGTSLGTSLATLWPTSPLPPPRLRAWRRMECRPFPETPAQVRIARQKVNSQNAPNT